MMQKELQLYDRLTFSQAHRNPITGRWCEFTCGWHRAGLGSRPYQSCLWASGFRIRRVIILCLLSARKTSLLEAENPDVCRKALHPILNEVASGQQRRHIAWVYSQAPIPGCATLWKLFNLSRSQFSYLEMGIVTVFTFYGYGELFKSVNIRKAHRKVCGTQQRLCWLKSIIRNLETS